MSWEQARKSAVRIIQRLRERGREAYLVGGCVRDMLLGRDPADGDYDVATSATPDEIQEIFDHTHDVGAHFGVVLVVLGGAPIEVATYRKDGTYSDGRRPDHVTFATLEEDAQRRDFTINALYMDPDTDEIIDPLGGRADLAAKLIRAIGEPRERFQEDRVRMLRAVRFSAWLGFEIEEKTEKAIRELAPEIAQVSAERIAMELRKMLTRRGAGAGLRNMERLGLLAPILPEVSAMVGVEQPPNFHPEGDVFEHTALTLDALDQPCWELALAALLHDVGKPPTFERLDRIRFNNHCAVGEEMAKSICARLKVPSRVQSAVAWLVRHHLDVGVLPDMRRSKQKRFVAHPLFLQLLELARADCLASHGDLSDYDAARRIYQEIMSEPEPLQPFVRGRDLIAMGLPPGPIFSKILREIEDAQLEGTIQTREEALAMAEKLAKEWMEKNEPGGVLSHQAHRYN